MQVLKFGGTSVACANNINKVVEIIAESVNTDKTIVVCSAISGITNKLIELGNKASKGDSEYILLYENIKQIHTTISFELIDSELHSELLNDITPLFEQLKDLCQSVYTLKELSSSAYDRIVSYGELLSSKIVSLKLKSLGINHSLIDSREIIKTIKYNSQNIVDAKITYSNCNTILSNYSSSLFILGGFIASDYDGNTTTLGRGGSDYTASLLAVGCNARKLEIWTDVDGMMTSDPRIVPTARTISNISYNEALELSHFGAKVVYPPTINPVVKKGIPIYIKNTFSPNGNYTLIENNPPQNNSFAKGISSSDNIALLSLEGSGMVGATGYCGKLFSILASQLIDVILITQASSVNTMCVVVWEKDAKRAKEIVDETFAYEISLGKVEALKVEVGFSIISLVGSNLKNSFGVSGRMFEALGKNGINIRAIAQGSSEKNITTIVPTSEANKAIRVIHKEMFEDSSKAKDIYLFVAGYGNVSSSLFHIINEQNNYIKNKYNINIVICGVCNSRKYILDKNGLKTKDIKEQLENGSNNTNNVFIEKVLNSQLHNTIFVDCTANSTIASYYSDMFSHNISVVTCNKIANSAPWASYDKLFRKLSENQCYYKYETTVGAALPIISTIDQIQKSGDKVSKVEAVLSGTLNYLFSSYDTSKSFANIIKEAKDLGYTEPDPRLDLKGIDVLRKLTIIARQIGIKMGQTDIDYKPFIEDKYFEGDLEDFYSNVEGQEGVFKNLYDSANSEGKKLRFIAKIENNKCSISLKEIDNSHPFYSLNGTDNAILIYSEYYKSPLLIQGAGAGGLQTASGVLNDILTINLE